MRIFLAILFAACWLIAIFIRSYRRAKNSQHWCETCSSRGIPDVPADGKFLDKWLCAGCVNDTINAKRESSAPMRAASENVVQVNVRRAA